MSLAPLLRRAQEPSSHRLQLAAPVRAYSAEAPAWGSQVAEIEEVDFDRALANSVTLIGTTGKDLELRTFENGKVGKVSLAVEFKKGVTHW